MNNNENEILEEQGREVETFANGEEIIDEIHRLMSSLVGVKRVFGNFSANITEEGEVEVSSVNGWKICYPAFTETWAVLANWIDKWDDTSKESFENFIKVIVFPTSMRLIDMDEDYIKDIVTAHINLTDRIIEKDGEAEQDQE